MFTLNPEWGNRVIRSECITCEGEITSESFRDDLSKREYSISGMCQKCQDGVFGEPEPDWDSIEELFEDID
jgi:hypothetical protein